MIKSISLFTVVLLSTFSVFGQTEPEEISILPATVAVMPTVISAEALRNNYRGCTIPIQYIGCGQTVTQEVEESPESEGLLDITDPDLSGFAASPNPTKGYLTISLPSRLIGYEIQVLDMTGRIVGVPKVIT